LPACIAAQPQSGLARSPAPEAGTSKRPPAGAASKRQARHLPACSAPSPVAPTA
jgi:hypothetical protein